jgi:hypothetical protein
VTLHGDASELQPIAVDPGEYFGDMVLISGLFICDNCHLVWA